MQPQRPNHENPQSPAGIPSDRVPALQARLRCFVGVRRPKSLRSRRPVAVRPSHCLGHARDLHRLGYLRLGRLALNIVTRNDSR